MNPAYFRECRVLSIHQHLNKGSYFANFSRLSTFSDAADILRILGR